MQRGAPGGARAEAERRRALALKALDQRLHAATAVGKSAAAGPSVPMQPQANTENSSAMLGETTYVPDRDEDKDGAH